MKLSIRGVLVQYSTSVGSTNGRNTLDCCYGVLNHPRENARVRVGLLQCSCKCNVNKQLTTTRPPEGAKTSRE